MCKKMYLRMRQDNKKCDKHLSGFMLYSPSEIACFSLIYDIRSNEFVLLLKATSMHCSE